MTSYRPRVVCDGPDPDPPWEQVQPFVTSAVERHAGSLIDWTEFWANEHTAEDWLVEPILAVGRGHATVAPAKAQKSLLALYVCAAMATGRPVLHRPAGKPVHVMYVDLEMARDDVRDRLSEMGYGPDVNLDRLHYHSLPDLSALDTEHGGAEIVELARHYGAELVVIDTLSRVLSGGENDADTLRAYYAYTGGPLKAAGIASWRLDHLGKDPTRGGRGTSSKNDDVDLVWQFTIRDQGQLDLKLTHRRMGWVAENVHLKLETDPLRYEVVDEGWPAGTADASKLLDQLDVPLDATRRTARTTVTNAGEVAPRNEVLGAALRFRRRLELGLR